MKNRYVSWVGKRNSSAVFSTKIRRAKKRGQVGQHAHPIVLPKRKKMSAKAWHEEFVLRCLRRGESVEQIAARWR